VKRRSEKDRRLRQADRLARALHLLELIQGGGRFDAPALAAEQECSVRTVFRDLKVLELAGVPWYFEGKTGGYRVRPDFRFPVLNLTDEELLGQATAAAITQGPGLDVGAGAGPTTQKLAAVSSEEAKKLLDDAGRVLEVLDLKLADHGRHREVLRTAQWALIRRRQLLGRYRSPYESRPVGLRLHPYRLCLVKAAWYLVARPADADRPKTYRVARFKTLRMVDVAAEVPEAFDLKAYFGNAWGVFRGDTTHDVEIAFTKEAAPVVTETTWHPTQKVRRDKDGGVTLSFRVDGLNEILHWALGWSGRARVVKPPELRALVVKQLRAALRMNEG
jgi:predicted DNA-binding transcriptional regulator YafY